MRKIEIVKYAVRYACNDALTKISSRTGKNFSRPTRVYGTVTYNCMSKCIMCDQWKTPLDREELSAVEWKNILSELRDWIGEFHINFGGGEPLLKKGILEILGYCKSRGILAGMVTNGFLIDEKVADGVSTSGLLNLNISIDGVSPATHDYLRGFKGAYKKVERAVDLLVEARERNKTDLKIIIKPLITSVNLHEIPELVRWTKEKGLTGVQFNPIINWTEQCNSLWVKNLAAIENLVEKLLLMKQEGFPIINDEENIKGLIPYFFKGAPDGRSFGRYKREGDESGKINNCHVGYTNLFIRPNGELQFCDMIPSFGNVRNGRISELWYSEEADRMRKIVSMCDKLCLQSCVVKRSFRTKLEIMLRLLK